MTAKTPRAELSPEERDAIRLREYRGAVRRYLGVGGMVPADRVQARIRHLVDERGITCRTIARRSGRTEAMVLGHYHGKQMTGGKQSSYGRELVVCRMDFEQSILATKFGPADVYWVSSCGTRRRIGALVCKGYTFKFIAQQLGLTLASFHRKMFSDQHPRIKVVFHREMDALYSKLMQMDPIEAGVSEHGVKYAARMVVKHGFVPDTCWDYDTIDDPDAFPEWTGECGTTTGYFLHLEHRLHIRELPNGSHIRREVLCQPCKDARSGARKQRRWTDEQQLEVLAKIDAGCTVRAVAEEYGCSTRTVERFKRERRNAADRYADV